MDFGIAGDSALVTASTSGLGLASAVALAEEGCDVAICGRDADRLAKAEERVGGAGRGTVLAVEADITDPDHVAAFVAQTVDEFGGLDHVVTSAGGPPSGPFLDTQERDWYAAYDLLVMSAVWTAKEAHPHLAKSGAGTFVAITSTSVREAIEGLVLSNAVRSAVIGLVKTLSREFAPDVRVNAVLPGAHETSRIQDLIQQSLDRGEIASYEEGLAEWSANIPLGRIGDPRELGDVVAFLSSERSSFVNGVALPVDGGRLRS
ncbi:MULTISPECIES: SDR family oxidoreductase [unclassified Haladaptatus]|uniref:SDR family oxidoreductase n=1 Tax=unclassified Haladaptatus TaxID=2622732 RepID=UPI0023E8B4C3|nr:MULTISPECIES: SDR family oxidoreductase [unclassified Haladaptatus]